LTRHCGVIIGSSGIPCMRSLTCKSHSVASKKAVKNRPKDFDVLLNEYILAHPPKNNAIKPITENLELQNEIFSTADSKAALFDAIKSSSDAFSRTPQVLITSFSRRRDLSDFRFILSFLDRSRTTTNRNNRS